MKSNLYISLIITLIIFCTGLWVITAGCESANRDQDVAAPDDFGPDEGGVGGDDDDSTDDDATDDDDDDSATNNLAVVYGNSSQNDDLGNFFTAYGFTADFVDESDTPSFDFTSYCAIVITETCQFYNTDEWEAIEDAQKKLFGMNTGGAILFGKLGLFADLGSSYEYSLTQIVADNSLDHDIWNSPYEVEMTIGGLIQVASGLTFARAHSVVPEPSGVYVYATIWGTTGRGVITSEDGAYMYWGMEYNTDYYLTNTYKLLANAISYLCSS